MSKENGKTLAQALLENIETDPYLNELYGALLYNYALRMFGGSFEQKPLIINDALRFADLLSKSSGLKNSERHRIWAQEIVALLDNLDPNNHAVQACLGSVLSATGNFQGLAIKCRDFVADNWLDQAFQRYRLEYFAIPGAAGKTFFQPQKKIYDSFKGQYFSYSAPTSLGKSYVMRMFIKEQLENAKEYNFAVLVPTKALIAEVTDNITNDLKGLMQEHDYRIVNSAGAICLNEEHHFIFVVTPERLLYILNGLESPDIDYLFIDEAHKISSKDGRSAFYYMVVQKLLEREYPTHIFFSSPNIPNPEVYLQLIPDWKNTQKIGMAVEYAPVSQEKFIIDLIGKRLYVLNDRSKDVLIQLPGEIPNDKTLCQFVHEIGDGMRNIVYCSAKEMVVTEAVEYANNLAPLNDEVLDRLAEDIRQEVHDQYYLADVIVKGVAYHMGYLPSTLRMRIEELFKDGVIKTMFCTSTLLEGVNLPADNLFITSHKSGTREMDQIDFKNLVGRVGRIEYNLYGNVFFVCMKRKTKKEKFIELVSRDVPEQAISVTTVLTFEQKQQIVDSLRSGNAELVKTDNQKPEEYSLMRKMATMLLRDIVKGRHSRIREEFDELLDDETLECIITIFKPQEDLIDDDINTSFDQNKLLRDAILKKKIEYPSRTATYKEVYDFLESLCKAFKWEIYERGTLGYVRKGGIEHTRLKWYTTLLIKWVHGESLKQMIDGRLSQYVIGREEYIGKGKSTYTGSQMQKNLIIGSLMEDIDNVLLFRLSNYFLKFSNTYKELMHKDDFSPDWYEFVEYGTMDPLSMYLQRNGFSRENGNYIKEHPEYVVYDENGRYILDVAILTCGNRSVEKEARLVKYNMPELFSDRISDVVV